MVFALLEYKLRRLDHNYYEACRTKLGWGGRQWSHD